MPGASGYDDCVVILNGGSLAVDQNFTCARFYAEELVAISMHFLADLLKVETTARRERYLRTRMRLAHLPFQRTLDAFDFRFQPSIDERPPMKTIRSPIAIAAVGSAQNCALHEPKIPSTTRKLASASEKSSRASA